MFYMRRLRLSKLCKTESLWFWICTDSSSFKKGPVPAFRPSLLPASLWCVIKQVVVISKKWKSFFCFLFCIFVLCLSARRSLFNTMELMSDKSAVPHVRCGHMVLLLPFALYGDMKTKRRLSVIYWPPFIWTAQSRLSPSSLKVKQILHMVQLHTKSIKRCGSGGRTDCSLILAPPEPNCSLHLLQ